MKRSDGRGDRIQSAYRESKNIYDAVLTQGNPLTRLYIRLFWSGTDDVGIARRLLEWVPEDFTGALLDVPVGTAVFTRDAWARLTGARIVCLDYSRDMIEQARRRLEGFDHISFVQGDVGALPMEDERFDIVMSMNGFHAFPDKDRAFAETWRVLRKGGLFIGCFYIKGKSWITDWLVRAVLSKRGWFTPPFQTEGELRRELRSRYARFELHVDGSIAYFRCVK